MDQAMNPETGTPYSRQQLLDAFNMVANAQNWKMPVRKQIKLTDAEVKMVREAVGFFAGCAPNFHPVVGKPNTYLVTAIGYYKAVGA